MSPRHLHIFKINYFVVVVLHARTAIYAFFALFGRCRFCFCFCSCFVVIGSVTNFYSVLVQYDGSLVWLFGFGNHLSLLFCDDRMPYLKTFQLHRKIQFSSRQQTKETTTGISTALALALTTRSGKRKRLDVSRSPSRVQTYLIVMNYFRRLDQEYDPSQEPRGTSSNMQHAKNYIQNGPQLY